MIAGQHVVMDRGHYAGRPGVITEVKGSKCTVVLTDTEGYRNNREGVTINNVKRGDYHLA